MIKVSKRLYKKKCLQVRTRRVKRILKEEKIKLIDKYLKRIKISYREPTLKWEILSLLPSLCMMKTGKRAHLQEVKLHSKIKLEPYPCSKMQATRDLHRLKALSRLYHLSIICII